MNFNRSTNLSPSLTFADERDDPNRARAWLGRMLLATAFVATLLSPVVGAVNQRIVVPAAALAAAQETCGGEATASARIQCVRGIFAQRHGTPEVADR